MFPMLSIKQMQKPKVKLSQVLMTKIARRLRECWSASGDLISSRARYSECFQMCF